VAVVGGAGLFLVLTRTGPGQRWLVQAMTDRVSRALGGEVRVANVRSADLLSGARLYGVEMDGPDGEPFVRADSVVATYFWGALLTGNISVSSLVVYGPRVRIARLRGQEASNVSRLFGSAGRDSADVAGGRAREITLLEVRVVGGSLEILTPHEGEDAERAVVVDGPGGPLRRIAFEEVDATLPRVIVGPSGVSGAEITVDSLGFLGRIFTDPLTVTQLEGVATWRGGILTVDASDLRLPGSEASGRLVLDFSGDDGLVLGFDVVSPRAALADVTWAEPRLSEGTARGGVALTLTRGAMSWRFTEAELRVGGDVVEANGRVVIGEARTHFSALDLAFSPLDLARLDPWWQDRPPVAGTVRGRLSLDGPLDGVVTAGNLVFQTSRPSVASTTADFEGVLHLGDRVGATRFRLDLDPLDWALLGPVLGDSVHLSGTGGLSVVATGRLNDGLRFVGEASHQAPGTDLSRVLADGSVRRGEDGFTMDVQGDLAPLSLLALRTHRPGLPVEGSVTGSVRARGPLSDLVVTASLSGVRGSADLEARLDLRDPGARYRLEGDVQDLDLGALVTRLPADGAVNGHFAVEGMGLDPDSASLRGTLRVTASRVGTLILDTVAVDFDLADGLLTVDTVTARVGGVDLNGGGALAVRPAAGAPELRLRATSDSLLLLRPLFMGESVVAKDTLSTLEWDLLALEGVDPETLPDTPDVAMSGRALADVVFRGSLERLDATGSAVLEDAVYRRDFVKGARVTFSVDDVLGGRVPLGMAVQTDSVLIDGRAFASGSLEVDYGEDGGWVTVGAQRGATEAYSARGYLRLDSAGGSVDLDSLRVRFDTAIWHLARQGRIEWDGEGLRLDTIIVARGGDDPMEVWAAGVLPRAGAADFTLDARGVRLDRLARLAQREDLAVQGDVDLLLRITGTARSPVIDGVLSAEEVRWKSWDLTRVEGGLDYRDGVASLDVDAWREGRRVLQVEGTIPMDLALTGVVDRFPSDRDMDVTVVADSLPAAFAMAPVEGLEDVGGTVAGNFRIAGTVEAPAPSGTLVMQNASWRIPALGAVRHENVEGTLRVNPDGRVDVDARARSVGEVYITGSVGLEPLSNPTFDLVLSFSGFQAVNRRDVTGRVSGDVTLTGAYRRPIIRGRASEGRGLRVDEGVLYVEEFRRTAGVVDLSDPRFLDLVMDTAWGGTQGSVPGSENPFVRNLWVDVSLVVDRDTWLRSEDLNVEIGGDDLTLTYDRGSRDLVLVGSLRAIRGSYSTLGRRFDVTGGSVDFVGIPGINPDLDIQARTRVRRSQGDPLDISATVNGTLQHPRVQLLSDERALAESDLVSYIVFGRPTYELTSGQAGLLSGATTGFLSYGFGSLTNQISSLVSRQWGLDYFAINQPGQVVSGAGSGTEAAQTSVEVGRYLSEDFFAVLIVRPLFQAGGARATPLGARLEWQVADLYRIEAFLDDRFLRSGAFGFRELGFRTTLVVGFSVIREWAY
jgi:hypothetical protein